MKYPWTTSISIWCYFAVSSPPHVKLHLISVQQTYHSTIAACTRSCPVQIQRFREREPFNRASLYIHGSVTIVILCVCLLLVYLLECSQCMVLTESAQYFEFVDFAKSALTISYGGVNNARRVRTRVTVCVCVSTIC